MPTASGCAAEAMGVAPGMVLKTLMAEVDGRPVCVVVPSDREVSMKRLAAAFGGKSAQMMKPAMRRVTGYRVAAYRRSGEAQIPDRRRAAALDLPEVYWNGGQRGLQVRMAPADAVRALDAKVAALVADFSASPAPN